MMNSQIDNIESLIKKLKESGKKHNFYYHYTTWESLKSIITNKSFRLTVGSSKTMNDQHEPSIKGDNTIWKNTFVTCFTHGSTENIAMWAIYGLPKSDAVRICIPKAKMIKWIDGINQISLLDKNDSTINLKDDSKSFHDMAYISTSNDSYNIHYSDKKQKWKDNWPYSFYKDPLLTGYVKNCAWEYEKEVRLIIRPPIKIDSEKIAIKIPDEVLESFSITLGPSFDEAKNDYHDLLKAEQIKPSLLKDMVNLKTLCDSCCFKYKKNNN